MKYLGSKSMLYTDIWNPIREKVLYVPELYTNEHGTWDSGGGSWCEPAGGVTWNMGQGTWDMGLMTWGMVYGKWDMGYGTRDSGGGSCCEPVYLKNTHITCRILMKFRPKFLKYLMFKKYNFFFLGKILVSAF